MLAIIFGFICIVLCWSLIFIKKNKYIVPILISAVICGGIAMINLVNMSKYTQLMQQAEVIHIIDYKAMPAEYDKEIKKYNYMLYKTKLLVEQTPYSFMKYQRDTINELDYIQVNERN